MNDEEMMWLVIALGLVGLVVVASNVNYHRGEGTGSMPGPAVPASAASS